MESDRGVAENEFDFVLLHHKAEECSFKLTAFTASLLLALVLLSGTHLLEIPSSLFSRQELGGRD